MPQTFSTEKPKDKKWVSLRTFPETQSKKESKWICDESSSLKETSGLLFSFTSGLLLIFSFPEHFVTLCQEILPPLATIFFPLATNAMQDEGIIRDPFTLKSNKLTMSAKRWRHRIRSEQSHEENEDWTHPWNKLRTIWGLTFKSAW